MENENGITQNEQHPSITQNEQKIDQQPVQPVVTQSSNKGSKINLKIAVLGIAVAIVLLVVGLFSFYSQKKEVVGKKLPPPEPENVLLATVGDKKIYREDVKKLALENYLASAVDNSVLKTYLSIAIERAIMDSEAAKLALTVSESEIAERKKMSSASKKDIVIKYELLKEKIMRAQIRNVSAFTVGFWIASFDYPQVPEYAVQREKGKLALAEIQAKFIANEKAVDIAKYVADSYPELREIVAINSYIYEKTIERNLLDNPKVYTLNPEDRGKPYNDDEVFDAMSAIKAGQIVKVERKDGSGGTVIKAIAVNSKGFNSYEDFINTRTKEIVKMENQI